jgi:hypothetical protein
MAQMEVWDKPVKYLKPQEDVSLPKASDELSDLPWYIYTDRANTPVYSSSSGQGTVDELDFGIKLAVLKPADDGSRLQVARESDIVGRTLPKEKAPLGWVESDKVLLWEKSIIDKKYSVDKKAMILFTIDAARQQLAESDEITSDVPVFKSPMGNTANILDYHQGLFQFFPIYKTQGDYLLLGESLLLDRQKEYNGLKGWVKMENVSQWSHRVAWEKNWLPAAVHERESNTDSIGLMVLATEGEAKTYANIDRKRAFSPFVTTESPYLEMKFETTRRPGPMGRFPVLDIKEIYNEDNASLSQAVKVGAIGEVMTVDNSVVDISKLYDMTNEIKTMRKINIIFVIDASESMESYRKSVIAGVKDALKSINKLYEKANGQDEENNDFHFGCVLYRDYHMQYTTQVFKSSLSQDTSGFFSWLDNNMVLEMNKRRDGVEGTDDLEEAMYFGIQNALDDYGPDENMSNYMILIGDCGDHQEDKDPTGELELQIDEDELIDELTYYNMNMLAFQVHHKNNKAYDLFQEQVTTIIEGIGQQELVPDNSNANLFELPMDAEYTGKFMVCEKGKKIEVKEMTDLIKESIIQINEDVNGKIKNIAKGLRGLGQDLDPWSTAKVIKFLIENDFSEEDATTIIENGMNQEYEVGYTVLQCNGYTYPNYQQVILFDRAELENVVDAFRDLAAAIDYPVSEQRIRLRRALDEWFPKYFSGVEKSKLKDYEVGKLLKQITGLDFGEKYNEITISKITDPLLVSDKKLKGFVKDVAASLDALEEIYSESRTYPARIEIPGDTKTLYVYIPGDVFPHE